MLNWLNQTYSALKVFENVTNVRLYLLDSSLVFEKTIKLGKWHAEGKLTNQRSKIALAVHLRFLITWVWERDLRTLVSIKPIAQ